jgi:hypothetical protein
VIHSKVFSTLVATVGLALGASAAGCVLEGSEPSDPNLGTRSAELEAQDPGQGQGEGTTAAVDAAALQPGVALRPPSRVAPVVREDHLLGGGGNDEGPRPHPWLPVPDQGADPDKSGGGSSPDKPSSN